MYKVVLAVPHLLILLILLIFAHHRQTLDSLARQEQDFINAKSTQPQGISPCWFIPLLGEFVSFKWGRNGCSYQQQNSNDKSSLIEIQTPFHYHIK